MAPGQGRDRQGTSAVRMNLLGHHKRWKTVRPHPAQEIDCRLELAGRRRFCDGMLGQPERTDEPGIAWHTLHIAGNAVVVIVLIPGDSSDLRLHPELLA